MRPAIGAATQLAAVIGDPVAHSLSPALHNSAYSELGLDMVYLAMRVPVGSVAEALRAGHILGLVGLSVTMPHKRTASELCDRLEGDSGRLGSVNTVTFEGDSVVGGSTDGEGFVRSLRDADVDVDGRRALVMGAGGAGLAVALALERSGASVAVSARRPHAARAAADVLEHAAAVDWDDRDEYVSGVDIVVNATPMGMDFANGSLDGGERGATEMEMPIDRAALRTDLVVADLVYNPRPTRLVRAAAACGAKSVDGLGMLVHQAGLQVERWTGMRAPVDVMRFAAERALSFS